MLHMSVSTPFLSYKEFSVLDDTMKKTQRIGRDRANSDELVASDASTAAPSLEASPCIGPSQNAPICGLGELLLTELSDLELPEAQEELASESEFILSGFEDDKEHSDIDSNSDHQKSVVAVEEDLSNAAEEVEDELLSLLSELKSLRAEAREQCQVPDSGIQKIPYPQLESGFLPSQFMPMQSHLMPSGHAETGQWACAMAPRPGNMGAEPLNICLGPCGATLEVACDPPEESEHMPKFKTKAVIRRGRGRSRSPAMLSMELDMTDGERGRSTRRRRHAYTW